MKTKISEMGVLKMMDAIEAWQADPNVHELTCSGGGGTCSGVKLIPKVIQTAQHVNVSGQEGSKIVLKCPKCNYVQEKVPDFVYQSYINTHMSHNIPLGQVVEIEITDGFGVDAIFYGKDYVFDRKIGGKIYGKPTEGVEGDKEIVLRFIGNLRALVVGHSQDCDGTPLYCLSNIRVQYNCDYMPEGIRSRLTETMNYKKWSEFLKTGICEEDLKVIEGQLVPLKYRSIFEYEEDMMAGL
jgi:DNA-directed RNA polymerase subunit M/transcription elongation factor TFIIS